MMRWVLLAGVAAAAFGVGVWYLQRGDGDEPDAIDQTHVNVPGLGPL